MTSSGAKHWIEELNTSGYAAYNDWRLPPVTRRGILLERDKRNDDLYLDPMFPSEQWHIWTGDKENKYRVWIVDFKSGSVSTREELLCRHPENGKPIMCKNAFDQIAIAVQELLEQL